MIIQNRGNLTGNFTIVLNDTPNDDRLSHAAVGVWLRLISKDSNWQVSIEGLVKCFPANRHESVRTSLKELCKFGYLVREVAPRKSHGQFSEAVMNLLHRPDIKEPLTDEQVEFLFSKKCSTGKFTDGEFKKMFPNRVSRVGSPDSVNPLQQSTEVPSTELQCEKRGNVGKTVPPSSKAEKKPPARRFKRTADKEEVFQWLKTLSLDTGEATLSFYAHRYPRELLEDAWCRLQMKISQKKCRPKSVGAVYRTLLEKQAFPNKTRQETNRSYAEKFKQKHKWSSLEIKSDYLFDKNHADYDLSLDMPEQDFNERLNAMLKR